MHQKWLVKGCHHGNMQTKMFLSTVVDSFFFFFFLHRLGSIYVLDMDKYDISTLASLLSEKLFFFFFFFFFFFLNVLGR